MTKRKVEAARPAPCSACPWRTSNHGKPHPHGWYTAKNRARLWSKLRRGDSMTCHPTDPENEVPAGTRPVSKDATTHECAGGLVLQQRELEKVQGFKTLKDYLKATPLGLTVRGFAVLVNRVVFSGVEAVMGGGAEMTRPDLNELVSHEPLGKWEPKKAKAKKTGRAP